MQVKHLELSAMVWATEGGQWPNRAFNHKALSDRDFTKGCQGVYSEEGVRPWRKETRASQRSNSW